MQVELGEEETIIHTEGNITYRRKTYLLLFIAIGFSNYNIVSLHSIHNLQQ